VVEPTHLKNTLQIGSFPQVGVKLKNAWHSLHFRVLEWMMFAPTPSLSKWKMPVVILFNMVISQQIQSDFPKTTGRDDFLFG